MMLTDRQLQGLRNIGNESEEAADEIVTLRAELDALRKVLDAALDVVVDLGGKVRVRDLEDAKQRRKDAERWRFFVKHAKLGFHGAPSFDAAIDFPVFHYEDRTLAELVDRAAAAMASPDRLGA